MQKQNPKNQKPPRPAARRKIPEPAAGALRPFARRVHRRHWLRRACLCACLGIGAGLVLLAAAFFVPIPHAMGWAAGLAGGVALLSALAAWFVRRRPEQLAAEIDGCGFQERVQTMLTLQDDHTPFAALQRADTIRALQAADPKACVPVRPPKKLLALAGVGLAAFLLLGFVPSPQQAAVQEREELREELTRQAEKVESILEALEKDATLDDARKAELNRQLKELAEQLRKGQDYKESIRQISALQQELGKAQEAAFQRELDALADTMAQQPGAEALAEALGQASTAAEAAEAARQAVAEAIENGDPQTIEELVQALRDAAAKTSDPALREALENLADALESGDAGAIEDALQQLADALGSAEQQAGSAAQALSGQLQAMKSQLGQLSTPGTSGSEGDGGNSGSDGGGANSGANSGSGSGQGNGQGQGQGNGSGSGSGQGSGAGYGSGEVVEGEQVYDPTRLNGQGQQTTLPGDPQTGGPGQQAEVDTGTGTLEGYIPYQQVVGQYAQDAIRSAQRAQLPPAVQDWVQKYFTALQQS